MNNHNINYKEDLDVAISNLAIIAVRAINNSNLQKASKMLKNHEDSFKKNIEYQINNFDKYAEKFESNIDFQSDIESGYQTALNEYSYSVDRDVFLEFYRLYFNAASSGDPELLLILTQSLSNLICFIVENLNVQINRIKKEGISIEINDFSLEELLNYTNNSLEPVVGSLKEKLRNIVFFRSMLLNSMTIDEADSRGFEILSYVWFYNSIYDEINLSKDVWSILNTSFIDSVKTSIINGSTKVIERFIYQLNVSNILMKYCQIEFSKRYSRIDSEIDKNLSGRLYQGIQLLNENEFENWKRTIDSNKINEISNFIVYCRGYSRFNEFRINLIKVCAYAIKNKNFDFVTITMSYGLRNSYANIQEDIFPRERLLFLFLSKMYEIKNRFMTGVSFGDINLQIDFIFLLLMNQEDNLNATFDVDGVDNSKILRAKNNLENLLKNYDHFYKEYNGRGGIELKDGLKNRLLERIHLFKITSESSLAKAEIDPDIVKDFKSQFLSRIDKSNSIYNIYKDLGKLKRVKQLNTWKKEKDLIVADGEWFSKNAFVLEKFQTSNVYNSIEAYTQTMSFNFSAKQSSQLFDRMLVEMKKETVNSSESNSLLNEKDKIIIINNFYFRNLDDGFEYNQETEKGRYFLGEFKERNVKIYNLGSVFKRSFFIMIEEKDMGELLVDELNLEIEEDNDSKADEPQVNASCSQKLILENTNFKNSTLYMIK